MWWLIILLHRPFFCHSHNQSMAWIVRLSCQGKQCILNLVRNLYNLSYFRYVDKLQNILWNCYLPDAPSTNSITALSPSSNLSCISGMVSSHFSRWQRGWKLEHPCRVHGDMGNYVAHKWAPGMFS